MDNEKTGIVLYANLLSDIKTCIRQAQVKATLSANAEMNQYIDSFLPQPVAKLPSECELTRTLPENLKSSLPSIEELEAELGGIHQEVSGDE